MTRRGSAMGFLALAVCFSVAQARSPVSPACGWDTQFMLPQTNTVALDDDKDFGAHKPPEAPRVQLAPIPPVVVTPGKPSKVTLDFRVLSGYHINSNRPKTPELIPTAVTFAPPTDIIVAKLSYPAGEDKAFDFSQGEKLNVYTGDFRITALVSAARAMPRGTFRVRGALKYQACDNKACYPPKLLPLEFDVKVQKSSSRTPGRNPGQSPHIHR